MARHTESQCHHVGLGFGGSELFKKMTFGRNQVVCRLTGGQPGAKSKATAGAPSKARSLSLDVTDLGSAGRTCHGLRTPQAAGAVVVAASRRLPFLLGLADPGHLRAQKPSVSQAAKGRGRKA